MQGLTASSQLGSQGSAGVAGRRTSVVCPYPGYKGTACLQGGPEVHCDAARAPVSQLRGPSEVRRTHRRCAGTFGHWQQPIVCIAQFSLPAAASTVSAAPTHQLPLVPLSEGFSLCLPQPDDVQIPASPMPHGPTISRAEDGKQVPLAEQTKEASSTGSPGAVTRPVQPGWPPPRLSSLQLPSHSTSHISTPLLARPTARPPAEPSVPQVLAPPSARSGHTSDRWQQQLQHGQHQQQDELHQQVHIEGRQRWWWRKGRQVWPKHFHWPSHPAMTVSRTSGVDVRRQYLMAQAAAAQLAGPPQRSASNMHAQPQQAHTGQQLRGVAATAAPLSTLLYLPLTAVPTQAAASTARRLSPVYAQCSWDGKFWQTYPFLPVVLESGARMLTAQLPSRSPHAAQQQQEEQLLIRVSTDGHAFQGSTASDMRLQPGGHYLLQQQVSPASKRKRRSTTHSGTSVPGSATVRQQTSVQGSAAQTSSPVYTAVSVLKQAVMLVAALGGVVGREHNPADDVRCQRFAATWQASQELRTSMLVYTWHRCWRPFEQLWRHKQHVVPVPDVLLLASGTRIMYHVAGAWQEDLSWQRHLRQGWDRELVVRAVQHVVGQLHATGEEQQVQTSSGTGPQQSPGRHDPRQPAPQQQQGWHCLDQFPPDQQTSSGTGPQQCPGQHDPRQSLHQQHDPIHHSKPGLYDLRRSTQQKGQHDPSQSTPGQVVCLIGEQGTAPSSMAHSFWDADTADTVQHAATAAFQGGTVNHSSSGGAQPEAGVQQRTLGPSSTAPVVLVRADASKEQNAHRVRVFVRTSAVHHFLDGLKATLDQPELQPLFEPPTPGSAAAKLHSALQADELGSQGVESAVPGQPELEPEDADDANEHGTFCVSWKLVVQGPEVLGRGPAWSAVDVVPSQAGDAHAMQYLLARFKIRPHPILLPVVTVGHSPGAEAEQVATHVAELIVRQWEPSGRKVAHGDGSHAVQQAVKVTADTGSGVALDIVHGLTQLGLA